MGEIPKILVGTVQDPEIRKVWFYDKVLKIVVGSNIFGHIFTNCSSS